MISRVWKRTLYKLGVVFVYIVGGITYSLTGMYVGQYFLGSKEGGLFGFYTVGCVAVVVLWIYQDAKREIELENEKLMRELRINEVQKKLDQL